MQYFHINYQHSPKIHQCIILFAVELIVFLLLFVWPFPCFLVWHKCAVHFCFLRKFTSSSFFLICKDMILGTLRLPVFSDWYMKPSSLCIVLYESRSVLYLVILLDSSNISHVKVLRQQTWGMRGKNIYTRGTLTPDYKSTVQGPKNLAKVWIGDAWLKIMKANYWKRKMGRGGGVAVRLLDVVCSLIGYVAWGLVSRSQWLHLLYVYLSFFCWHRMTLAALVSCFSPLCLLFSFLARLCR